MPELFGHMPDGTPVHRVVLDNGHLRVAVLTFGAVLQSIEAPGRDGARANVVLGLTTLEEYVALSPHFGAVPGRYAGRIAGARFTLDGVEHHLPANDGPHTLHGGPAGFGKRAWTLAAHSPTHAHLALHSPDGDAGFPGAVDVAVRYSLQGADLHVSYHAETTRPTVINLTNHSYFNLAGEGSGSVLDHRLMLDADHFTPIDAASIPTGEVCPVDGTPFDFRVATSLGARIRTADPQIHHARGYDQGYLLNGTGLRRVAVLTDPGSDRSLAVATDQPALQLYTANKLDGGLAGPSGRTYRQSDAVCLETQHLADSPNQPAFPTTVLRPHRPFTTTTIFAFSINSAG